MTLTSGFKTTMDQFEKSIFEIVFLTIQDMFVGMYASIANNLTNLPKQIEHCGK
jgi:hypothetical protein